MSRLLRGLIVGLALGGFPGGSGSAAQPHSLGL